MHDFRKLSAWTDAVNLATLVYKLTEEFPSSEIYGITNQLRRASVSVSSNIAEGAGRNTDKDFQRFLAFAKGSCYELETQLLISGNLGYISKPKLDEIVGEVKKIQKKIYNLIKSMDAASVN